MIWIITLLIIVILAQQYMFYKERQKLLDRIQSGGLNEYKKFEDKTKPKEKKESINEYANLI